MGNWWKSGRMFTSVLILFALSGVAFAGDEKQAKLRFYHDSFDNYTELTLDEAKNIFSSKWYNSSRTTVIFCHGFTGHPNGPAVNGVVKAYLEQGRSNVALLNWDRLAAAVQGGLASSYLNYVAPNAVKLGADFADTLLGLSAAGLDLNKTHLVGHSLGAQVFGIAGNKISEKGRQLLWITGLDPAGILFDTRPDSSRLNPKSARFVAVIHTDPSKYGTRKPLGTVDFWPNFRTVGPVAQPGCDNRSHQRFSAEDLCNHNRCWQLLVDSIKNPSTLMGTQARNFRMWKRYSKEERLANVLEIGKFSDKPVSGNYYLLTTGASPYGLGEEGL